MSQVFGLQQVNGNGTAADGGTATTSVIAAQGAGKVIRITRGVLAVTLAATGGSGLVRICDGTTTIQQWDGNAIGAFKFDFGDTGYPLTANTAFQIIVSGAITAQATASIAAVGLVS